MYMYAGLRSHMLSTCGLSVYYVCILYSTYCYMCMHRGVKQLVVSICLSVPSHTMCYIYVLRNLES